MQLYKRNVVAIFGLMVFLFVGGCATDKPDNPLQGHLITELYPAFNSFNLPFYVYYTAEKFASEKLPDIKKCNMKEDGSFQVILSNPSGDEKYLIVNRFGRIIEAKGFK